jgi:hypothetical protein
MIFLFQKDVYLPSDRDRALAMQPRKWIGYGKKLRPRGGNQLEPQQNLEYLHPRSDESFSHSYYKNTYSFVVRFCADYPKIISPLTYTGIRVGNLKFCGVYSCSLSLPFVFYLVLPKSHFLAKGSALSAACRRKGTRI